MTVHVRKVDIVKDSANVAGRKKIIYVDASSNTTVPAGSSETIIIQPPQGKIWKVIAITFEVSAPPGATSGDHRFRVGTINQNIPYVKSNYDAVLRVWSCLPVNYSSLLGGATVGDYCNLYSKQKGSYDYPLRVEYNNYTDADQINTRAIKVILEEEDEAQT